MQSRTKFDKEISKLESKRHLAKTPAGKMALARCIFIKKANRMSEIMKQEVKRLTGERHGRS
jgi:hypothetical protein